jgi:hypothetical protein
VAGEAFLEAEDRLAGVALQEDGDGLLVAVDHNRISTAERRDRERLRSERRRRAAGIMPRKPAEKPWLAAGISRSTWL